ncbi:hypothetical protein ACYOEI_31165, partial [Singulisphaera rosea]
HFPDSTDKTVIQLKDESGVLLTYQGAVDLGDVDVSGYMSGASHTLSPLYKGGINVVAKLDSSDTGKAKTGIGSAPKLKDTLTKGELAPQLTNALKFIFTKTQYNGVKPIIPVEKKISDAGGGTANFSMSTSFVVLAINNQSVAEVGPNAVLRATAGVSVKSTLTEKVQTADDASVSKPSGFNPSSAAGYTRAKDNSFAAAVAIVANVQNNTSVAIIDGGARVDAGVSLDVSSAISYPFAGPFLNPGGFNAADFFGKSGFNNLLFLFDSKLGLSDWLVSNWANAGAKSAKAKAGITLSLDVTDYTNHSEARIDPGALINQDAAYQGAGQSVSVTASTTFNAINYSGNTYIDLSLDNILKAKRSAGWNSILPSVLPPAQASIIAVGGSTNFTFLDNTTTSSIGSAHTFDPAQALGSDGKTLDLGYYLGLETGEAVVYSSNGGTPIEGLVSGRVYYAVVDSAQPTQMRLAATLADALANKPIALSATSDTGTSQSLQALNASSAAKAFD